MLSDMNFVHLLFVVILYKSLSSIGGCEATKLVIVFDGKTAVLFVIDLFSCD